MKKRIGVVALITLMLLVFFPVYAQDKVTRYHRFELGEINEVEINNSVGSIELRLIEGSELRIEVEIEGESRGFFRDKRDVGDVDLEASERGNKLTLTIDDDDVEAHWIIELPAVSNIDIDMGVGEIDVEIGASNLDIDLGVGEVDVIALLAETGEIEVSSGVGDANINGSSSVDRKRHVVSEESEARGEGDYSIEVEVGVGSATVTLN